MVRDQDGNLITNEESIIQKFQPHFENILNIDHEDMEKRQIMNYYTALPLLEEPKREEIQDIIATLKNNKALVRTILTLS